MGTAGRPRERSSGPAITIFRPVAIAPPGDGSNVLINIVLTFGRSVASYSVEVGGEWNLGVVDLLVVGLERRGIDLRVRISVYIVECGCP